MPRERTPLVRTSETIVITLVGLIVAAVPPALWVAWTQAGFLAVLGVGVLCTIVLIVLLDIRPFGSDEPSDTRDDDPQVTLPDEFVEEVHRISPLTYHHGLKDRPRFRDSMRKLRELMRSRSKTRS